MACAFVFAGAILGAVAPAAATEKDAAKEPSPAAVHAAYFEGKVISFIPSVIKYHFTPGPLRHRQREFTVGPWQFGSLLVDRKPKDSRRNLYIVSPGMQYRQEKWGDYDHNEVVSDIPRTDKPVEWDIYWAILLDPALRTDFRSERDIILAAQEAFVPGDLIEFRDIPGEGFLRAFLHIDSMGALAPYRRADGTVPRLIIVPANSVILGSVANPELNEPAVVTEHSGELGKR